MKIVAINGSPRKEWNTATLLTESLKGAASQGAQTELIHLYDLDYIGCTSCFACRMKGGKSYGKCAMKDDLTPVLEEIANAQALIFGSPIYFGSVTGALRSFQERLMAPYFTYTVPYGSMFPRKMRTGAVYTMNIPEEKVKTYGYEYIFNLTERYSKLIFGVPVELLCSFDTYQFDDYSKMVSDCFDPVHKAGRRKEVFPQDCQKAFELGQRLMQPVSE